MAGSPVTADTRELAAWTADLQQAGARVAAGMSAIARKYGADVTAEAMRRAPVRTGNLRASISAATRVDAATITVEVGPTASYGVFLELGTRRMAPRPFMGPAHDQVIGGVVEAVAVLGEQAAS